MQLDVFLFFGFTMDPREKQPYESKIYIKSYESKSELDYFIHFLPVRFIKETLLPATNTYGKKTYKSFVDVIFEEFVHILGILYSMEVY